MATESERTFEMMLSCPGAYGAHVKGFTRAVASGVQPERAAQLCGLTADELAGALRAFKGVRRAARRAGRGIRGGAGLAVRAHPLALAAKAGKLTGKAVAAATGPIRRKIFRSLFRKLIARRARLIAWQRRRDLRPAPGEVREARAWATAYVRRKGLLGKLVAAALSGDVGAEPLTTTVITASIPLLLALARRALKTAEREGAPADPRASDGASEAPQAMLPAASASDEGA